ncbi:unnamed protein product [Spodoptera littoralis]|uniref:Uncharacterized protein n=1 Tax=Spodoptera littoralis TaxID=7109 RepID=A0A9P0N7R5_SPOLI|nr:unnamed protein product [Spodoptera littoralis]CAH1644510.1 unnamed protein product [Spodoptera littoralis]
MTTPANYSFNKSKLYYADTLGSNLVGCYKHKSDEKADIIYSKTQNVGKSKNRPIRSHVNTRMGVNNNVDRYRKPELDNQTFLSKCFRSLFKKNRHNNVNQSFMTKNHSDPSRKVPHFGSDLLNNAKFLKQAKPDQNFASNDKTQTLINNHHMRNISSQVHYKTHSRATGITKLLRRCFCTANMQYEVQKQAKSRKVLNNLNLNSPIIKYSKTTRKLKHFEEPIKLERATRTKIYNVTKDEYSKDNFKERMSHSTRTYKRIHQNSQIIRTNYPTYNTTSYLSERSRTYQPKVQYKSREWLPYPNYCVLRCENSENSKFVQFNSNFGMCIDYPKNKHGKPCPGTAMDKCNQLQGTGDGHGPTAREGKASKKSQIEVDYTDKSIGEQQLNSKNTQFKRKTKSKSKSVTTSPDTRTQQENINGNNPTIIILEEKEGGIIQATQTDRELKTIMPYSKKKFDKLDSTTKLSHHSTNTPAIKKTRTKGQKRNENLVSNKYGDYLVYHQQSLKCNTTCQYGQKTKGSDNKSPGDNIVADRNAKQDNIITNRNATQDNIIAKREASQDDSDETRLDRIRKNFRRRPREKSDIQRPLSENMAPKGNIIVLDKDEELPRSDHQRPLGRWRHQNGRNAKQDNIIANRKATQDDIIAKGDATQDDSDDTRFERIKRAFRRRPREEIHVHGDPDAKRDIIILRPRATPDNVVVEKEKEDKIDETRLELIRRAFRRRPTEQPAAQPEPAPQEPLFEMVVHKNDMSIANPQEVLPMLSAGRVYRGTAPPAQQSRPRERAAPDSLDDRLELLRRAFRRKPKQPESEKPMFEMVVHKNKMLVMNKDEVFPILDSPEKRYRSRKDESCAPPVMEMHVDRTTASIINADEIVTKLKAERQRQMVKKHRGGLISQSEGEALVKLHGKTCNCCFCRRYKQQAQKGKKKKAAVKTRHLKPCTCGSDVCLKDWTKLRDEQADMARVKDIPPCVCGSDVCKNEFEKMPKKRLEAARLQRQKEINEINRKKYQQARKRRLKQYRSQDLKRIRRREAADRRQMNKIKKIKGASPVVMAVESIRDLGAYGFRCLGGSIRSFSRVVRRPKDAVYNLQDTVRTIKRRPDTVVKKIKQNYKDSGLKSTLARIKERAVRTTIGNRIKTRMESNAITNYLVHITDPDPKARMQMLKRKKRRRRRRHTEPVDFECSLYMNTLRKRPFLRVYYMCPWFYPHCVNLFGLWKQLANVLMFLMAVCVWSPCILCFELCRAMACCCMCTGYDM